MWLARQGPLALVGLAAISCAGASGAISEPVSYRGGAAPLSRRADQNMVPIPAGTFIAGSSEQEREQAYRDYQRTAGHDGARAGKWFERELARAPHGLHGFVIDRYPVTQAEYAEFVRDTGTPAPFISAADWQAQKFIQDYQRHVKRFNWRASGQPPASRGNHPVVLVRWREASAYCQWRGDLVGKARRLPSEFEFERAARGTDGRAYPWGNTFDPKRLNSAVGGPLDTVPVTQSASHKSPAGVFGMAGNVFHWTQTPWKTPGRYTVKGSAWDDYGGLGRAAQRHGRAATIRHAIVGFRCSGRLPSQ